MTEQERQESRRARFQKQKELAKHNKKKRDTNFESFEYETPEFVALEKGKLVVVRLLGGLELNRDNREDDTIQGNSSDPLIIRKTWLKGDNGKLFPFIWPYVMGDSPLYEIIKAVGKYDWDKEAPKGQQKKYVNQGCELLLDITCNGDKENTFATGWSGSKFMAQNCIDRVDTWCKENKHSKLLVKGFYENDDHDVFPDPGYPVSVYNTITEDISDKLGLMHDDFDVGIIRYKKPIGQEKKIYYNQFAMKREEPTWIAENFNTDSIDYNKVWVDGFLTEEEQNYELYNLDEMFRPTSITKFFNRKKKFIAKVDAKYGENFTEMFSDLSTEEKKKWDVEKEVKEKEQNVVVPGHTVEDKVEDKVDLKDPEPIRREAVVEGFQITEDVTTKFPFIKELTETELKDVDSFTNDELKYKSDMLAPCNDCKHKFPVNFTTCPKCGKKYTQK